MVQVIMIILPKFRTYSANLKKTDCTIIPK